MKQLFDILRRRSQSDKTALICGPDNISYRDLYTKVIHKETKIKQHSIYNQSRTIGIFIPNSIEYVVAYFTIALSNKVIVPIDVRNKKEELLNIVDYCELNIIITNTYYCNYLKQYLDNKNIDLAIYDIEKDEYTYINNQGNEVAYTDTNNRKDLENIALMLRTSGSLSKPKRVMLTNENLITCAESIITHLKLREEDIALVALPLYLASGNTSQMLTHLYLGATLVIMDAFFTADYFIRLVEKYRVTNFTCVPYMLYKMYEYPEIQTHDISSLRFICFGGAPTPTDIIRLINNKYSNVDFIQMYGQTEVATRISHLLPNYMPDKIGSVGQAIPNLEIKLVNESMQQIAVGQIGEVLVRGKTVMKGYFKRKEATSQALEGGWLHTGDMGRLDEDEFLYIVGRKKNIIIKGGTNIFPEEIEEVLQCHPAIKEVLVYSKRDEQLGEIPLAKVVIHEEMIDKVTEAMIKQYCIKRISSYKIPEEIMIVEELPKTASGKIARC